MRSSVSSFCAEFMMGKHVVNLKLCVFIQNSPFWACASFPHIGRIRNPNQPLSLPLHSVCKEGVMVKLRLNFGPQSPNGNYNIVQCLRDYCDDSQCTRASSNSTSDLLLQIFSPFEAPLKINTVFP